MVADWAADELGLILDRWQRRILVRALAVDDAGRLVHRVYVASTGRQNGKTALVRSLLGFMLTSPDIPPWQLALGVAHDREQARIPYNALLADLEPMARRRGRHLALGGLRLTRYLGIRSAAGGGPVREYRVASREARHNVRSLSIDLAVLDEVRTQRDEDTWAALLPTTTARPQPLIVAISTAGDDRSVVLRRLWEHGRRVIAGAPADGFGMTWYAPPDDADPEDPAALELANPAIADGRLSIESILADRAVMTPETYRMEHANLWARGTDEWLPWGIWERQRIDQPPDPGRRVVLGVDVTPGWRHATISVAIELGAGRSWAGIAAYLEAPDGGSVAPTQLTAQLEQLHGSWSPAGVAYSGTAAAAPYVGAWAEARDVITWPLHGGQLRSASELLRAELVGGRLGVSRDELLDIQRLHARPSGDIASGSWYLSHRHSAGEVDAIRAVAWAAWAAISPEVPITAPQVFM